MPTGERQHGSLRGEPGSAGELPASDDPILLTAANWKREGWEAGPHLLAARSIVAADGEIRALHEHILKPYGLTPARHDALAELFFSPDGAAAMGALSRKLMLRPTSITSTVDALEHHGLAERVPHPDDGRATLARITALGRTVITDTCRNIAAARCGLGALTDHEALVLFELLRKVRSAQPWLPSPGAAGRRSPAAGAG
jgi:DNA-binding MarR family transcriptional regulator